VKLADLADRPAPRLSGGQQQRVRHRARPIVGKAAGAAVRRAAVESRRAAAARDAQRAAPASSARSGISSIYVTHGPGPKQLAVSDWIMVMKDGPHRRARPARFDIYRYPRHIFTAPISGHHQPDCWDCRVDRRGSPAGSRVVTRAFGPIIGSDPTRKIAGG